MFQIYNKTEYYKIILFQVKCFLNLLREYKKYIVLNDTSIKLS